MAINTAARKQDDEQGVIDGKAAPNRTSASLSDTAADLAGTARDTGVDIAKRAGGEIKNKAGEALAGQRESVASGLTSISEGLRRSGDDLRKSDQQNVLSSTGAEYLNLFADKAESISGYIRDKDISAVANDLKQFARRNPAVFIGAAFLAGIALTRFLKSGASADNSPAAERGH